MPSFLLHTFGRLSPAIYLRHVFFGSMFPLLLYVASNQRPQPLAPAVWAFALINTVLYPYARVVYEGVVDFIVGRNVFVTSATVLLFTKFVGMACCWMLALVMAPMGLAWLCWRQRRPDR
jgi:hypothetical protein